MGSNPLQNQENEKSVGVAFGSLLAEIFINRLHHNNNGSNSNLLTIVLTPSLPLISSPPNNRNDSGLGYVAKEEVKIKGEINRIILSGDTNSLIPNSGQPIPIYGHNICNGFHDEIKGIQALGLGVAWPCNDLW